MKLATLYVTAAEIIKHFYFQFHFGWEKFLKSCNFYFLALNRDDYNKSTFIESSSIKITNYKAQNKHA